MRRRDGTSTTAYESNVVEPIIDASKIKSKIEKSKFIFLVQWIDRSTMETVGRDARVDAFAERSWIFRSFAHRSFVRSFVRVTSVRTTTVRGTFGVLKTRINIEKCHRRISVQTARLRGNTPHPRRFVVAFDDDGVKDRQTMDGY